MQAGFLLIDKPQFDGDKKAEDYKDGILRMMTSRDLTTKVGKKLHMKKVGHAGTLDPMATGLMIIAAGWCTRLLGYFVGLDKQYEATVRFGISTETQDAEGEIVDFEDISADKIKSQIDDIVSSFIGDIEQTPGKFSAIKINGKPAYKYARKNIDVEIKPRKIRISDIKIKKIEQRYVEIPIEICDDNSMTCDSLAACDNSAVCDNPAASDDAEDRDEINTACSENKITKYTDAKKISVVDVDMVVDCSSGTYIRSLAEDMGKKIGVPSHLLKLRRTRVGDFSVEDAEKDFDDLCLIDPAKFMSKLFPIFEADDDTAKKLQNGNFINSPSELLKIYNSISRRECADIRNSRSENKEKGEFKEILIAVHENEFVALTEFEKTNNSLRLKPVLVPSK